jgi:signal transduction histidine kinase/CheY-like chemotaxis protein
LVVSGVDFLIQNYFRGGKLHESESLLQLQEYHQKLTKEVEKLRNVRRLRDKTPRICYFQLTCPHKEQIDFTFIAPGICNIFDCSEDYEDKSIKTVFKKLGQEEVTRLEELIDKACSTGNMLTFVTELDDGRSIRLRGRPRLCEDKGQLIDGYLYTYSSEGEAKKTQVHLTKHLALGIEQSNDAFILMNLEGGIIYRNTAASKILDLAGGSPSGQDYNCSILSEPHEGKVEDQKIFDFDNSIVDGPTFGKLWDGALQGEVFREKVTRQLPSGEEIVLIQSIAPVFGNEGNLTCLLAVAHDITEQSDLEARLYKSVRMEAIGNLSAGIAHDFNNVLTAILCQAATASEACSEDSESGRLYGRIMAAGQRAADLVDQIIVFGGNVESEAHSLLISPLIRDAVKLTKTWARDGIEFIEKLDPKLAVMADSTHIHQIVTNLCSNAVKAIEESPASEFVGTVSITSELTDGDMVKITISDTGCGMDARLQKQALEPFFTTRKAGRGTGIGLSVVQDLVTLHGGFFDIESTLGEGTTINITFPATEHLFEEASPPTSPLPVRGRERILVVDDEDHVLEAVSNGLRKFGYHVTTFLSPVEALEWDGLKEVDLVLSDLTMPEMSGHAFLDSVSELWPHIPLILCSGYNDKTGSRVFIRKPFTPGKLAAFIRQHLDEKSANYCKAARGNQ